MDFRLVSNYQLNSSSSKYLYSFPKSKRFKENPQQYRTTFYTQKGALTDRSVAFGKQERSRSYYNKSPAPNILEKKKGYSFSKGQRGKFSKSPSPGPARYYSKLDTTGYKTNGYSFTKDQTRSKIKTQNYDVGPGDYLTVLDTLRVSSIFEGKYKNAKYGKIGTDQRFRSPYRTITPGPGAYNSKSTILSGAKNQKGTIFPKSSRMMRDERSISPGPGDYNRFSVFAKINKPAF